MKKTTKMPWTALGVLAAAGIGGALAARARLRSGHAHIEVPGRARRPGTAALEAGARVVQPRGPLAHFDTWLVGFHPLQAEPHVHMEAHHYCRIVNEDFIECVVFDGGHADARLTGVEYIVSEALFESLPDEERRLWHPHNYEIFSGSLVAPGLPAALEDQLMKRLVNSYGKTWHFWRTGQGEALPCGEACLAWSFNRDGQVDEGLERERNARMGIDREAKRARRARFAELAHPQQGVDRLDGALPRRGARPPGVEDARRSSWARD